MPVLLLDIDGTLLRTAGAGRQALEVAFAAVHGWRGAMVGVDLAGATDGGIVAQVSGRFGAPADLDRVRDAYLDALSALLAEPGRAVPCAGVPAALDRLARIAELALLTGNWRAGAARKLAAASLPDFGLRGAFGDDAIDRNELVPIACARLGRHPAEVVIVGDTPADVACARAGGARVIVVETGFATPEALRAAEPDLLVPDLEQGLEAVLRFLER